MGSEAGGNFDENLRNNGNPTLTDNIGLIPRFMEDLFGSLIKRKELSEKALLQQSRDDGNTNTNISKQQQSVSLVDFRVSASFLEVYGEDIFDLLDEDRNDNINSSLKIREDSNKEVIVVGLKSAPIDNAFQAMNVLNTGTMNRTTASTLMNLTSRQVSTHFSQNLAKCYPPTLPILGMIVNVTISQLFVYSFSI